MTVYNELSLDALLEAYGNTLRDEAWAAMATRLADEKHKRAEALDRRRLIRAEIERRCKEGMPS